MIGDEYAFEPNRTDWVVQSPAQADRFSAVLTRRRRRGRGGSPMVDLVGGETSPTREPTPPEPIYLLNFEDDLSVDCQEFQEGLDRVLREDTEQNIFAQKRICIMIRERGYDFVGDHYWKQVRDGEEIHRVTLNNESEYRAALETVVGIKL